MFNKNIYFSSIRHERKPFFQLSWLNDFTVNRYTNLFVHEKLSNLIPWTFL